MPLAMILAHGMIHNIVNKKPAARLGLLAEYDICYDAGRAIRSFLEIHRYSLQRSDRKHTKTGRDIPFSFVAELSNWMSSGRPLTHTFPG